ncbi:hypothetical protein ACYZTL_25535 [Pseudomonas sp. LB3P81]
MKPPKKIKTPNTPETDLPARNTSGEDATIHRFNLPDINIPNSATSSSGSRRPESESNNTLQQPRIEVVDISTQGPPVIGAVGATSDINFLPPLLVPRLSAPRANGIRYGQRNSMYAEIENEGVTLVRRREDDEYQASSASELNASGPILERIAGTAYWRRKNTDVADDPSRNPQPGSTADEKAGPSTHKRPRLDEEDGSLAEAHPLLVDLLKQPTSPVDLSSALLRNWGHSTKPHSVESLEINGLHYRIVPHGSPEQTGIAFLEHPRFSPSRYEAFEQMLRDDLSLQPKWAVKKNGQWEVLENRVPFERSLTGYVAETFRDFSDESLNKVAKTLFNRANDSDVINSQGLMALKQTFRNWADAGITPIPRRELTDPLLMLPVIHRTTRTGWLATPPSDAAGTLRRLDFTPREFLPEWNNFRANSSNDNLKRLVKGVLERNGYDVFPLTNEHQGPALVFTRKNHDTVFFLNLDSIDGHGIRDTAPPGNELSDPHLSTRIGDPAQDALRTAYDQNRVAWLLGGTQTTTAGWQSVFIIREG